MAAQVVIESRFRGPADSGNGGYVRENGAVAPEIVWSVLDCPGGISTMLLPDVGMSVLGRMAARIDAPIETGMTCVALG